MTAHVMGICGATGGLGATTLAAAVALRAASLGQQVVAVDSSRWGTALGIALAMEGTRGLRWGDLARSDGDLPGDELVAALPRAHGVGLLAEDGLAPVPGGGASRPVVHHARRAVAEAADLVVVDLPPVGSTDFLGWASWCHAMHVLVGSSPTTVAVAPLLPTVLGPLPGRASLVVRSEGSRGAVAHAVEEVSGCPVVGLLDDDPSVARSEIQGRPVGSAEGPVRELADALLLGVLEGAA